MLNNEQRLIRVVIKTRQAAAMLQEKSAVLNSSAFSPYTPEEQAAKLVEECISELMDIGMDLTSLE